ncbi:hypothetical protein [Mangrovitalea sediminis]|uniref:hypothetical protein n=1 Tax=Mangrovitalea sediminis TaxID=1982043 RepID=UPI00117767B4|nr:hypothetical protein [Mangrovitalea sediminis]
MSHQSTDFAIEAKQAWQNIGDRARVDRVAEAMELAWDDCGNLHHTEANIRLAAVFAAPFIAKSSILAADMCSIDRQLLRHKVSKWVNESTANCDAFAACFPSKVEKFINKNGYLFPGVLLLLRARYRGA